MGHKKAIALVLGLASGGAAWADAPAQKAPQSSKPISQRSMDVLLRHRSISDVRSARLKDAFEKAVSDTDWLTRLKNLERPFELLGVDSGITNAYDAAAARRLALYDLRAQVANARYETNTEIKSRVRARRAILFQKRDELEQERHVLRGQVRSAQNAMYTITSPSSKSSIEWMTRHSAAHGLPSSIDEVIATGKERLAKMTARLDTIAKDLDELAAEDKALAALVE